MLFISRFHQIVRNKILWGAFAIVVCASFALSGYSMRGCRDAAATNAEGRLFGEAVPPQEYRQARYFEFGLRGITPRDGNEQEFRRMAWKRLATLRMARRLGLTFSDDVVARAIQNDPTFQANGAFDEQRYRQVVESNLRIGVSEFEEYVRQDLALRTSASVLSSAVWAAPYEIKERLDSLTDQFTAQYVVLTTNAFARDVTASNATVQTYYDLHKQEFTVPAKMRVRYVAFSTADREASIQVSDEAVREYYTNNLSDYTTIETNGMETLTALDKVREGIVTKLRREQAQTQTEEQASAFTLLLDPHRRARAGGTAMTFDAAAAAQPCAVHTTDWFTATEPPAALRVDAAFCRSAFALEDDKENCFSEPVAGSNAVYVLAWHERKPEYVPDLDEVRAKVVPLANAEARQAVLRQKAGEVHGAVLKALAANRTFKDAVKDFGLNVSTTATFTVYEGLGETVTNGHAIAQQIVNLGAGEVSEPAALGNDMLIVYAASRQPGDIAAAAALRPQLVDTLDRYQSGTLFNQWGDYLLATAKFEDLRALTDGGGDTPTPATPDREGDW